MENTSEVNKIRENNQRCVMKIRGLLHGRRDSITKMEAALGFGNGTVGKWAKGAKLPPYEKLMRIADYLDISVNELYPNLYEDTAPPATEGNGRYGLSSAEWKQIGHCFGSKLAEIAKAPAYLATDKTGLSEDEVDAFIRGDRYVTKAQIHAMAERMGMELDYIIKGYAKYFEGEEDTDIALEAQLLRVLRLLPDADKERLADYARILARSNGLDAEGTAQDE